MMRSMNDGGWSPYVAGALTGVVMVFSVWVAGKYFGASTMFVRSAGMVEKALNAERVSKMPYFVSKVPKIDWQWMFVFGILVGSLISAKTSGSFRWQAVPNMWKDRFGSSRTQRGLVGFFGGLIAMYGARLAGG